MWDLVAFWTLAVLAVASAALVFRVDSMARATVLLLASFLCVAGEMLLLDLHYLGALVVLMMTAEMAIMAVFMIMLMMNPAGLEPMSMVHNRRGALVISVTVFLALAAAILLAPLPERAPSRPADPTHQLGTAIMGGKMLVMMIIGAGLFATMIAATVLATARGRYGAAGEVRR
ncbi:NADH-quinone oxidoreductase subunit J [Amycolatopsis aidingensis]|uniref:NADH-quinone oxidoreductase subunit J n=1 Tax=Amycolatopsis aidingensis TaxID=2842453 RepID=UPI001C0B9A54|nr:NADH-quinone oxidoreductase subunit J [Amycolatopsis aidingensis]